MRIMSMLFLLSMGFNCLAMHLEPVAPDQDASEQTTGIHVRGVWTIEVRNADGTLDKVYNFENALVGPSLLTSFLEATLVTGGTYIELTNSSDPSATPCGNCSVGPSTLNSGTTFVSTDYNVQVSGTNFEVITLAGNITASTNGTFDTVASWVCVCSSSQKTQPQCAASPDSCAVLTRKTLTSPVTVNAGQIVQITVAISFS